MLPSFSRGLRLALVLALSAGYITWHGHTHSAYAAPKGGGDDEESDDSDDDKGKDTGPDEGDDPDDKDQPAVTAGGLFTMASYPVNELLRPLTMTQQITQLRLGVGTDVSSLGAFGSAGVSLEGQHGYADNFTIIGGFTSAYNFKQFEFYGGFEGALLYDVVDVRLALNAHRFAIPHLCGMGDMDPAGCTDSMGTMLTIPNGIYNAGKTQFSLDIGFPFRYAFKPEIAIVALQTLMSVDFNSVKVSNLLDKKGQPIMNTGVPDLLPSLGVATNPIPALSLVVFGQLRIVDFNPDSGYLSVPLTARVEFSPNQKLDIGLEFTLLNVKPPDPQKPFDNRFVNLFIQSRFGK